METFSSGQYLGKLNDCLRSERSAVETYSLALKHVGKPELSLTLNNIRESHNWRMQRIADFLHAHGVEPVAGGGTWGALSKLIQSGANLLGDKTALASLREFESHCLKMYKEDQYPKDVQEFINAELLPRQERTFDQCLQLKRFVD